MPDPTLALGLAFMFLYVATAIWLIFAIATADGVRSIEQTNPERRSLDALERLPRLYDWDGER